MTIQGPIYRHILVIGNGFDLQCGLKSRFSDFFEKTQLRQYSPYFFDLNNYSNIWYVLLFLAFYQNHSEIEKPMPEYTVIEEKDYAFDPQWMNVEEFIKTIMTKPCSYPNNSALSQAKSYLEALFLLHKNRNNVNFMDNKKQARIIKNCFRSSGYFENINEFQTYLYMQLVEFENDFKAYLVKIIESEPTYNEKAFDLANKILSSFANNCYVLNFNYTKPAVFSSNSKYVVNSIHGDLKGNIIIGFDGSDVVQNFPGGLQISKSWQKMFFGNEQSALPKNKQYLESIIFYGHSLGEEDYSYFHALFDYYDIFSSNVRLVFCYSEYSTQFETADSIKAKYVSKIQNLLNKYVISTEKEKNNKTIVSKLQLENRISIVKI